MKIEIWDEKKTTEEPLRLRLKSDEDGGVTLVVVNKDGNKHLAGNLLSIRPDGTLYLHSSVNECFGLKLNKHGKLEVAQ